MIPTVAPGWYPDPQGPGQRYWDGQAWGPRAPQPAASVPPFPPVATLPPTGATSTVAGLVPWREADSPVPDRRRSSVAYYLFVVLAVISAGLTLISGLSFVLGDLARGGPWDGLVFTLWSGAWTALWVRLARRRKARSVNPEPTSGSPAAQTPEAVPAGWYDDPDGSGAQRWWDGQSWTTHRGPTPRPSPPGPAMFLAPTLQPPPNLKPAAAQHFPQPLTSASNQVPKVKGFWAGLPTMGRLAVVAAPIVVILIAIIAAGASSGNSSGNSAQTSLTCDFAHHSCQPLSAAISDTADGDGPLWPNVHTTPTMA